MVNPTARPGLDELRPVTIKDTADTTLEIQCKLIGAVVAKNLTLKHDAVLVYDVQLENQTMSGASVLLILSRERL